jgi:hypothetical protein
MLHIACKSCVRKVQQRTQLNGRHKSTCTSYATVQLACLLRKRFRIRRKQHIPLFDGRCTLRSNIAVHVVNAVGHNELRVRVATAQHFLLGEYRKESIEE